MPNSTTLVCVAQRSPMLRERLFVENGLVVDPTVTMAVILPALSVEDRRSLLGVAKASSQLAPNAGLPDQLTLCLPTWQGLDRGIGWAPVALQAEPSAADPLGGYLPLLREAADAACRSRDAALRALDQDIENLLAGEDDALRNAVLATEPHGRFMRMEPELAARCKGAMNTLALPADSPSYGDGVLVPPAADASMVDRLRAFALVVNRLIEQSKRDHLAFEAARLKDEQESIRALEAEERAREADRAAWIESFGSERLKLGVATGHKVNRLYQTERVAQEAPGFAILKEREMELRERLNPSLVALQEAQRTGGRVMFCVPGPQDVPAVPEAFGPDMAVPRARLAVGGEYEGTDVPMPGREVVVLTSSFDDLTLVRWYNDYHQRWEPEIPRAVVAEGTATDDEDEFADFPGALED